MSNEICAMASPVSFGIVAGYQIDYKERMITNVIEVALDPRKKPLLRLVARTKGYDFFGNGHYFVLKALDGRCVQFDFEETTVEMSHDLFEAVLAEIRLTIENF
jgi:hypothetical protein